MFVSCRADGGTPPGQPPRRQRSVALALPIACCSSPPIPLLSAARNHNPKLELLGVLIDLFTDLDAVQAPMLDRLRQMHGELLLEPPVPYDPAVRDWPLTPGAGLPAGPAADAFAAVAGRLRDLINRSSDVVLGGDPLRGYPARREDE